MHNIVAQVLLTPPSFWGVTGELLWLLCWAFLPLEPASWAEATEGLLPASHKMGLGRGREQIRHIPCNFGLIGALAPVIAHAQEIVTSPSFSESKGLPIISPI